MTAETPNPFIAGARVAISDRWNRDALTEGFVEKVYKNGRFTLRGSSQQWRPYSPGTYSENKHEWRAHETGDGFAKGVLTIWNEHTNADLTAKLSRHQHSVRWQEVRLRVDRLIGEQVTPEQLAQIEAALPVPKPKSNAA